MKNIIFDMGNVLMKFDPLLFIQKEGIENNSDIELLLRYIFKSEKWIEMDKGLLSEKDLEIYVLNNLPKRLHNVAKKLIYNWHEEIIPIEGMENLIEKLKNKGHKIYLLSNAAKTQHDYWYKVPGNQFFDGKIISADIKMIKPDKKIYEYILDKYKLKASESIFIDDVEENVMTAKSLGIRTFLFKENVKDLEKFLSIY